MSDPTLPYRLAFGLGVLLVFLLVDLRRHGRASRRLAEYVFLATATATAMTYGALNDLVAMQVSPAYFTEGKQLGPDAGPMQIAWLGMQAGWSAGLVLGVALLFANNPGRLPTLPMTALYRWLPRIVALTAGTAVLGALVARTGVLNPGLGLESADIGDAAVRAFVTVWGINLGAYAGAVAGTVLAVVQLRRSRRKPPPGEASPCSSPLEVPSAG